MRGLLEKKIIGGLALEQWYPELGPGASLWCATEVTKRSEMDAAAAALSAMRKERKEEPAKVAEEVSRLMDVEALVGEELRSGLFC